MTDTSQSKIKKSSNQSATLYLEHFNLTSSPFKITPTTGFFYGGGRRSEILHALLYGIESGEGIAMVSGEVGSGKTMMLRTLIDKLPDNIDVIYIANPSLSGREIIYHICEELQLHVDASRPDTVRLLQNHLIEQHTKKRRIVAFIDEAQAMPDESLEEIRLLSNLETNHEKLLQIILFGQPELEEKLSQQSMRQLRERITVNLRLKPFNHDDIKEYINTRMRVAGYSGHPLFSKKACRLISVISQGLSRRINVLADRALLSAYERGSNHIEYIDAQRAVKDANFGLMRYRSEQSKRLSRQITIATILVGGALLAISIQIYLFNHPSTTTPKITQIPTDTTTTITPPTVVVTPLTLRTTLIETVTVNAPNFPIDTSPKATLVTINELRHTPDGNSSKKASIAIENDNTRQDLIDAIKAIKEGSVVFDHNILAQQLSENVETHTLPTTKENWQGTFEQPTKQNSLNRWTWMPPDSYLRGRLKATHRWLQQNKNKQAYVVRLMTVSQNRAVFLEQFLRYFANFYPIRNTMVYPVNLQAGKKFVVTFGIYGTRQDADIFLNNIPLYFNGGRPFIQTIDATLSEVDYS